MASRVLKKGVNRLTQGFSSGHKAVDLGRAHVTGEPVIAHSAGRVVFCQTGQKNSPGSRGNKSYGNCVKIEHGGGYYTLYAHLASVAVTLGQTVAAGQVLGQMGNTGNSYGMHLHFEVRQGNKHLDPTPYLESDLPIGTVDVTYRAYAGSRWWPTVKNCEDRTAAGYAGVRGCELSAVQAVPAQGVLRYRVHRLGKGWLPWVENDSDFAGVRGQAIDALQAQLIGVEGYEVCYRVSPVGGGWYGWCTGLTDATGDGYAGVFGRAIDRVQMKIVRR